MAVYLLHFERPLQHAQHYLGFTDDTNHETNRAVETRLSYHLAGRGSRLMKAVVLAGIEVTVARVWPHASREFERKLKRSNGHRVFCPLCIGEAAYRRGTNTLT